MSSTGAELKAERGRNPHEASDKLRITCRGIGLPNSWLDPSWYWIWLEFVISQTKLVRQEQAKAITPPSLCALQIIKKCTNWAQLIIRLFLACHKRAQRLYHHWRIGSQPLILWFLATKAGLVRLSHLSCDDQTWETQPSEKWKKVPSCHILR